jgi:hypothetical protein
MFVRSTIFWHPGGNRFTRIQQLITVPEQAVELFLHLQAVGVEKRLRLSQLLILVLQFLELLDRYEIASGLLESSRSKDRYRLVRTRFHDSSISVSKGPLGLQEPSERRPQLVMFNTHFASSSQHSPQRSCLRAPHS